MLVVLLVMDGKEKSDSEMATGVDGGDVVMKKVANDDCAVDENESQKRMRIMTAKEVTLLFENLQRTRKQKLNQVNKIKQKVNDLFSLKITCQTVTDVETQINKFDKYCKDAEELHNSIVEMPIPQDEYDKQNKWFRAKMTENQEFYKDVKERLADTGKSLNVDKTCDASSITNSEIGPDDSISNVSTKRSHHSKASKGSTTTLSSTSSARIKAMAEKAALLQHAAAMERRHVLEEEEERLCMQNERLKKQKEQLMMVAKIAANDAKLLVLTTTHDGSSRRALSDDSKCKKSQSHSMASLPPRVIPIFDGDPLQFTAFIQTFEHGIERKTTNSKDCLYYQEQYTRGQPRELVRSCQHMPAEQGFKKAKDLLKEHFGHELSSLYGKGIELACNKT